MLIFRPISSKTSFNEASFAAREIRLSLIVRIKSALVTDFRLWFLSDSPAKLCAAVTRRLIRRMHHNSGAT
jgi:hypothetical protein